MDEDEDEAPAPDVRVGAASVETDTDEDDHGHAFLYVPDLSSRTGWTAHPVPRRAPARDRDRRPIGFR